MPNELESIYSDGFGYANLFDIRKLASSLRNLGFNLIPEIQIQAFVIPNKRLCYSWSLRPEYCLANWLAATQIPIKQISE
jgi:hypothetical protein